MNNPGFSFPSSSDRRAPAVICVSATAAAAASVLWASPAPAAVSLGTALVALGALAAWIHATAREHRPSLRATISLSPRGVHLDGRLAVARGDLLSAAIRHAEDGSPELCLSPRGARPILVRIADEDEGRAWLGRLELGAGQAPASFPVARARVSASSAVAAILCAAAVIAASIAAARGAPELAEAAVVCLAMSLISLVVGHAASRPELVVGRYGIERREGRLSEHFAFADITSVAFWTSWSGAAEMACPQGILVHLRDGTSHRWVVDHDSRAEPSPWTRSILLRVHEAMGSSPVDAPITRSAQLADEPLSAPRAAERERPGLGAIAGLGAPVIVTRAV